MRRCLAALIVLLACVSPLFAQRPKVLVPRDPVLKELPLDAKTRQPAVLRSMVGGLWMTDANFKSSIQVSNVLKTAPLTITPTLYLSNGKALTLADVTLEPSGTAVISISDALAAKGLASWATLYGYVDLQYKWAWDAICATVHSVDTLHSVVFTSGLQFPDSGTATPSTDQAQPYWEGMWWKQESNVTGFVALSNISSQPLHASVSVTDASENRLSQRSVTISPHGTKLIELKELQTTSSSEGGVWIQHDWPDSAIVVTGGLEDLLQGYSATIPFYHSPPIANPQNTTIAELGLMTGTADPMMQFPADTVFTPYSLVRNISDEPVSASLTLYWTEGATDHSVPLPQLTLAPHRTQNIALASLLSQTGLKNYNGSFDLVFEVAQNSGSLLMLSGSVDAKNTYVFEVLPRSADKSIGKSIGNWSTANGDDTMVTLWNPADEAQELQFTLFFSGGQYKLPLHLGPRATRGFNISEVVQNQIPDADGNVIPPTVHEGGAELTGPMGVAQHILVAVDAATYNVRKATCNWGCISCNNMTDMYIIANPFSVAVGGQTQLTGTLQLEDGARLTGGTWSSSNTAIATVSGGLTNGVGVGNVTIIDNFGDYPLLTQACGGPPPSPCPEQLLQTSGGGTGTPKISLSPSLWYFNGNPAPSGFTLGSTTATLTASGGGSGTYGWSITNGSSKAALQGTTSGQNITSVQIQSTSYSTTENDVTVQLQFEPTSGNQSVQTTYNLSVDSPYKMILNGYTDIGVNTCSDTTNGGLYGYKTQALYTAQSFLGVTIINIGVNESLGPFSDDYSGNNWPGATAKGLPVGATGGFADTMCVVDPNQKLSPRTLTPRNPLGSEMINHSAQSWFVGSLTPGSGIQVQSDTEQFYEDHGRHLTIVSPVR